jgi:hypothetical protein
LRMAVIRLTRNGSRMSLLRWVARPQRQVITHYKDKYGNQHQSHRYP